MNSKELLETAKAASEIVAAVPVYDDLIGPCAKELGKALKTGAEAVNALLSPITTCVWGYEQMRRFLVPSLAAKLGHVPKERWQTPPMYVAGPALEGLRYCGDEPTLRELYANLLAGAMDKQTAKLAHPSYADIIRRLTPDEARIIVAIRDHLDVYVIDVNGFITDDEKNPTKLLERFSAMGYEAKCVYPDDAPRYFANLDLLGLVDVSEFAMVRNKEHERLEQHRAVRDVVRAFELRTSGTCKYSPRVIFTKPALRGFCDACAPKSIASVAPNDESKSVDGVD